MAKPTATGRVTGSYTNGAGQRVWIVSWDDGVARPLVRAAATAEFHEGQQVRLVGASLESNGRA